MRKRQRLANLMPLLSYFRHELTPNLTKLSKHLKILCILGLFSFIRIIFWNYFSHKISVLGSRDQLCLLPEVLNLESNPAKVYQCRLRVSTRTCEYYRNFDGLSRRNISLYILLSRSGQALRFYAKS